MNWPITILILCLVSFNLYRSRKTWLPLIQSQWLLVKESYAIMTGKKQWDKDSKEKVNVDSAESHTHKTTSETTTKHTVKKAQ